MKKLLLTACASAGFVSSASAVHIWINEFHYDNTGADTGEFVEIALSTPNASGFSPTDYIVEFYNGSNGNLYDATGTLDGFDTISPPIPIAGSANSITLYSTAVPGLQNGNDAIALVNITNGTVESFLSYEGAFTADADNLGIAGGLGLTATDIGVFEAGTQPIGGSVAASGTGSNADDFDATSFIVTTTGTPGALNDGQFFAVPEPGAVSLLGLAGILAVVRRRR